MTRRFVHETIDTCGWVPPWLRHQQATRYEWARTFVNGLRVLEVGCGAGHGTRVLASGGATETVGIDIDGEAIRRARNQRADSTIRFLHQTDTRLPFNDREFDVVVALETIEHVEDAGRFVEELSRVVKPGGWILLSTPNRTITNAGTSFESRPTNPLHVREWTRSELENLLRKSDCQLSWYGQTFYSSPSRGMLSTIGNFSQWLAVRTRQAMRLLLSVFDTPAKHQPCHWTGTCEPEVLVVVCRKQSDTDLPEQGCF
ncbi:MAG TPA: class I SAM-dependent methyltransferase [Planctomicrobium sp.]|nr:class I SAM-dependent methyltransferase [Planctomicrobium sp.]